MNIEKAFKEFNKNIRLTDIHEENGKIKYDGVCKKIHDNFYKNYYIKYLLV